MDKRFSNNGKYDLAWLSFMCVQDLIFKWEEGRKKSELRDYLIFNFT